MANSPLVSIRIPGETLERLDQIAQELYPSRRSGKSANRSQVILDAIEQFIEEYENQTEIEPEKLSEIQEQINQIFQQYQQRLEHSIKEYINQKFLAYAYNLEHRLQINRRIVQPHLPT